MYNFYMFIFTYLCNFTYFFFTE